MQSGRNCQRHVWLLSGTGEGPVLANALLNNGWKVTVSVVTQQASFPYSDFPLESLRIGALGGSKQICRFLKESKFLHNGFDWVIDLTHPFAQQISADLQNACKTVGQPLLRYERPVEDASRATLISDLKELSHLDLSGQNLLMAIGSRHLREAAFLAREAGAKVFARILPTPESLRAALNSSVPERQIAVIRPFVGENVGEFERAICRKWSITGVVCRQSGGLSEKSWQRICEIEKLDLWLITRPSIFEKVEICNSLEELLARLNIYS